MWPDTNVHAKRLSNVQQTNAIRAILTPPNPLFQLLRCPTHDVLLSNNELFLADLAIISRPETIIIVQIAAQTRRRSFTACAGLGIRFKFRSVEVQFGTDEFMFHVAFFFFFLGGTPGRVNVVKNYCALYEVE